jgi:hypothetical protein
VTIIYRPARPDDLESAVRIVQQAYNDLRVHHGLAPPSSKESCKPAVLRQRGRPITRVAFAAIRVRAMGGARSAETGTGRRHGV